MVGQLRNVEQVRRQPAHELAGAVAVKIVKGQLLHVAEQVPADIRLHQDAEGMAPVADDIRQNRPEDEGREHHRHDGEKGVVGTLGQQLIHAPAGDIGKRQVDDGDHQSAAEVHEKQPPVRFEIRKENTQGGTLLKILGGHGHAPCLFAIIDMIPRFFRLCNEISPESQ